MLRPTGRGRFPVVPKSERTINGVVFDSKKEARRYSELLLLERAGEIHSLTPQYAFKVSINGKHYCTYTADSSYVNVRTGERIYEDVKSSGSAKDAAYRLRRKACELFHNVTITEVLR